MIIKKDTPCVFIRIPNFNRNTDIIKEHIEVLKNHKSVFLMKMGRGIRADFLDDIISKKGYLILKNASKYGNKFYLCNLENIRKDEKYVYPDYYNDIFEGMGITLDTAKKDSLWLKIISMKEVDGSIVDNFKTLKNHKSIYECALNLFQVSIMYGSAEKNIEL